MQRQLVLNDIRPRPRIHSTSVINGAVEAFLLENDLSMILPDFSAGDEEWLRQIFSGSVSASTSSDAWAMASSFAEQMHEAVCEDYVDLFERFVSHLSKFQEDVLRDWVASGGAINPLAAGEFFRAEIGSGEGRGHGIAFNDTRYAATGKFTFLADDDRASSISADGDISRLRILEWETILSLSEPTDEDREICRRDKEVRMIRDSQSQMRLAKAHAERERNALLAANQVAEDEARRIYSEFAFTDEAAAARTANAILSVLTAGAMQRFSPPTKA